MGDRDEIMKDLVGNLVKLNKQAQRLMYHSQLNGFDEATLDNIIDANLHIETMVNDLSNIFHGSIDNG